MAKRRKLTAPSQEELGKIEQEFRGEVSRRNPAMAPISQVAAEAASEAEVLGAETREKLAEAEVFREAKEQGLVLVEIPLEQINAEEIFRDRLVLLRAELDELRDSILMNGLRLPVEVFELDKPREEQSYGLISGFRRLMVMREIAAAYPNEAQWQTIKAIVRPAENSAKRFAAVVEENEVRAGLSHYERGRYVALTAANGVFQSVDDAVKMLFPVASKAKRSKVRSFALIHDEIGDMLSFPEEITEKQGLRLAQALRAGAETDLREALAQAVVASSKEEWPVIEAVLSSYDEIDRDPKRGGRPTKKAAPAGKSFETSAGIKVNWGNDAAGGYKVSLKGQGLDRDVMESLMLKIEDWLGK